MMKNLAKPRQKKHWMNACSYNQIHTFVKVTKNEIYKKLRPNLWNCSAIGTITYSPACLQLDSWPKSIVLVLGKSENFYFMLSEKVGIFLGEPRAKEVQNSANFREKVAAFSNLEPNWGNLQVLRRLKVNSFRPTINWPKLLTQVISTHGPNRVQCAPLSFFLLYGHGHLGFCCVQVGGQTICTQNSLNILIVNRLNISAWYGLKARE